MNKISFEINYLKFYYSFSVVEYIKIFLYNRQVTGNKLKKNKQIIHKLIALKRPHKPLIY